MKCELIKSDCMDNWYTIEKVEHANEHKMIPYEGGASLYYSGRVSDACVEGSDFEMLSIAEAIDNNESASFKRCSAQRSKDGESYLLSSPRNSQEPGEITLEEAKELAVSIRKVVA